MKLKRVRPTGTHLPPPVVQRCGRRVWPEHLKVSIVSAMAFSKLKLKEACKVAGITPAQYRDWSKKQQQGKLRGSKDWIRARE